MTFEDIARNLVDRLNARNIQQNEYDKYVLDTWYDEGWPHYGYRAVIYHNGGRCTDKPSGLVAFTKAGEGCKDYDAACKLMLKDYIQKVHHVNLEFSSSEELIMLLEIYGIKL